MTDRVAISKASVGASVARSSIQAAIDKAVEAGWSVVTGESIVTGELIDREMKECCPLGAALIDRPGENSLVEAGRALGLQGDRDDLAWFSMGFDRPEVYDIDRSWFLFGQSIRRQLLDA